MAKIAPEYIHEFLGKKFKNERVYMRLDECIMAQKPAMRKSDSELQKQTISRFKVASELATELKPLYRANYMPLANRLANHNTPRSLFMKHLLLDVIRTNPATHEVIVYPEKIRLEP